MLRKTGLFISLFFVTSLSVANSVVTLNNSNNVVAKTSFNLSLNQLIASVTYSIVCYIDTTYSFQTVYLSSIFGDSTSKIMSYSLNGNLVTQSQLNYGHNIMVINGFFTTPGSAAIVITNLDQTNPFTINNCFAIPV